MSLHDYKKQAGTRTSALTLCAHLLMMNLSSVRNTSLHCAEWGEIYRFTVILLGNAKKYCLSLELCK